MNLHRNKISPSTQSLLKANQCLRLPQRRGGVHAPSWVLLPRWCQKHQRWCELGSAECWPAAYKGIFRSLAKICLNHHTFAQIPSHPARVLLFETVLQWKPFITSTGLSLSCCLSNRRLLVCCGPRGVLIKHSAHYRAITGRLLQSTRAGTHTFKCFALGWGPLWQFCRVLA